MCRGISAEVIWDGQKLDAKFGHPLDISADRDHHTKIRALHGIRESDGNAASRMHAPIEAHPATALDDVDGYELAFESNERPDWWNEEMAAQFRKFHLAEEIRRRMNRVIADGLWPGSLCPIKDCKLPDALTSIGGGAYFRGWTGSTDALTSIGGDAYFGGWTGSADALTSIGGGAYFRGWTGSTDALTSIGGGAYFRGWTGSTDALTSIGGDAYFGGWTGSADALTSIGGGAYFRGWTGSADALTSIGGGAYFRGWTGSADALTSIGGGAYFGGWTGSADALTSIGGGAYFRDWTGSAKNLSSLIIRPEFRRLVEISASACRGEMRVAAFLGRVQVKVAEETR